MRGNTIALCLRRGRQREAGAGQRRVIWINFPALAVSRQHGNRGQEGGNKDFLPLTLLPANDVPAEILQDELGGLSFASSRFSRDHQTLVELIVLQVPEGCFSQGEHMGLQSSDLLSVIFEDICLQEKSINIVA